MHSKIARGSIAVAGLGLAAGLVGAAPAHAAATSTTQVRPVDLIAPTGTAGSAVMEFLAQGVHLRTTNDTTDFARGAFKVGVPLSQVTAVDYTWYGTQNAAPGVKYFIDADADGKIDGELRGEKANGGQDVWLNSDTQDFPDSALPDDFFKNNAPCNGAVPASGVSDPCGGSGADQHGTLANWAKRLQTATGKAGIVQAGGFSLSGVVGDGVLTQITYGPNQYVLTNLAKAKVSLTAAAKRTQVHKAQKVKVTGHVEPAGTGAVVSLEVKKSGKWTTVKHRALAAAGNYRFGDKPTKLGVNRYRVEVTETNATMAATSSTVKVRVTK